MVGLVGVDAVHGHREMSSFGIAIPSDPSSTFFLSAGGGIWSVTWGWSCRGRCSVWTRSFQAVKSCVAKWKGSTWFNMVQRHFAPSSLPQLLSLSVTEAQCIRMCCCGKWSEWSNETLRFHNLAHRILLSACAHCRALLSQSRQRQWVWTMSCHES